MELRDAGYHVQILEYNDSPGGRNWSLYGGDTYTELGGTTQKLQFADGLYLNPRPWRIPHHHYALIDYCKRLKVQPEPFVQVNKASYLHSAKAFGGRPQRFRAVEADFTATLLSYYPRQPARENWTRQSRSKTAKYWSRRCVTGARWIRNTSTERDWIRVSAAATSPIRPAGQPRIMRSQNRSSWSTANGPCRRSAIRSHRLVFRSRTRRSPVS
jgi:monoamine oxidase